jgi:hypothetical protein
MKSEFALLATILRDWQHATATPALARAILFAKTAFREAVLVDFVRGLLVHDGNWQEAIDDMPRTSEKAKVEKLRQWLIRVTRPALRKPILLGWPTNA